MYDIVTSDKQVQPDFCRIIFILTQLSMQWIIITTIIVHIHFEQSKNCSLLPMFQTVMVEQTFPWENDDMMMIKRIHSSHCTALTA